MRFFQWGVLALVLSNFSPAQQSPVPVEDEPHHHVVLKNDVIIVLRVKLLPGESTLFHTHARDRMSVQLASTGVAEQQPSAAEGPARTTEPGDVSATTTDQPFTHRVHNVGAADFEVLDVEFFHRAASAPGPAIAKVEAENPSGRIYKWTLAPGATSATHSHQRPYLIVSATPLVLKMTDPDGKSMTHELKAGDLHWVDAKVTHSLVNAGTTAGTIIEIESK